MWDELYAALRRKAAAGVEVRLMVDDMGSLFLIPDDFARTLEADGIRCLRFNPFVPLLSVVMNNRDHRKILVVDGHTAFNGGINLADEYINHTHPFGHWKDTGVRVEGEAVRTFTAMFLELWQAGKNEAVSLEPYLPHRYHPQEFASEGLVQPFGDSPLDGEPVSANVYADILAAATDYVYIMTPYLIIDDVMRSSLVAAAKRGGGRANRHARNPGQENGVPADALALPSASRSRSPHLRVHAGLCAREELCLGRCVRGGRHDQPRLPQPVSAF